MTVPKEPAESKLAAKAWAAGQHDVGRHLYRKSVENAQTEKSALPPSFYLSEWARMEGTIGNREAFDALHHEVALEPDAPFLRLCYARDLWTEFKDAVASLREIDVLEELLASARWDRAADLAPMAYAQKIETLRAWISGEPGGPLWP